MDNCKRKIAYLGMLAIMTFLSSCSTKYVGKKDGPPKFHVDESQVQDAVPKPEPLAKYGNMRSYVVFGKRYYTMKSSQHYNEVGTASWYGTQFHEHSTSSGEPYNMLAMTAAHKTLPLPTYVEVTNLANNRKVIVKVNDRGPFESKRIIDLSYVAAKKLGMLGRGTANVRVKAINPYTFGREFELAKKKSAKPIIHAKANPVFASSVYVQVGAFRNKTHAHKLQQRMENLFNTPVQVAKGKLYRVQIGPIQDIATANQITNKLQDLGIKSNKLYQSGR